MADKGKHPSTEHHHEAAARHSAAAHHHYQAAQANKLLRMITEWKASQN
jgi:hypothetical protein